MADAQWLDLLASALGVSPSFARALALEPPLARAGLDVNAFTLAPSPNLALQYTGGLGLIEADLVGPDNWGQPVTIGFKCVNHAGEQLDPRRVLDPHCSLHVAWLDLPIDQLRARYATSAPPLLALPSELASRVDWERFTWPEVPFLVTDDEPLDPKQLGALKERLDSVAGDWNAQNETASVKWVGEVERDGDGRVEVFIDFGDAPTSLLVSVIRELLEAGSPRAHVVIGRRARR
jgi:hypothetical protein